MLNYNIYQKKNLMLLLFEVKCQIFEPKNGDNKKKIKLSYEHSITLGNC